jgi:hypothetical protein
VRRVRILLGACGSSLLLACTAVPPPGAGELDSAGPEFEQDLVPAGFGTMIQDELTLTLFAGDLRIKITPLAESITRLAAPDTYRRLHDLAESNRAQLESRTGTPGVSLFLVSFFTRSRSIPFEPANLHLLNRGIRFRPMGIRAVSPGFGEQRLRQEEPQIGVYAYAPEIDLEIDLAVEFEGIENAGWTAILTHIREERGRVRARARGR